MEPQLITLAVIPEGEERTRKAGNGKGEKCENHEESKEKWDSHLCLKNLSEPQTPKNLPCF